MAPGEIPGDLNSDLQVKQMESESNESFDPLAFEVNVDVLRRGAVREMRLPPGWLRGERKEPEEEKRYSYELFHPGKRSEIMLWSFYRGHKASDNAAQTFNELLSQPPHMLTAGEFKSIAEIIRDKSNPDDFRVTAACTAHIDGKPVLIIEGRYIESQEDAYTIYVNSDGTGKVIEELHYRAPKSDFPRYLPEAKGAFGSIKWK